MPTARLILCEKTSRWAVAFRRALGKRAAVVCETRSLPECQRRLSAAPASAIALEVTAGGLEAAIAAWLEWSRLYPRVRVLALLEPGLTSAEPLLREAGAIDVLHSIHDVPAVAGLVLRHLALAPPEELPLRDAIVKRLPWADAPTPIANNYNP